MVPTEIESKWFWKMEYCLKNGIPSAQTWAWNEAEEEYNKYKKNGKKN